MTTRKTTPIGAAAPSQAPQASRRELPSLARPISGTPIEDALDEQRGALWEAHGIIKISEVLLMNFEDWSTTEGALSGQDQSRLEYIKCALRRAAAVVYDVACATEPMELEKHAAEIAAARRDQEMLAKVAP